MQPTNRLFSSGLSVSSGRTSSAEQMYPNAVPGLILPSIAISQGDRPSRKRTTREHARGKARAGRELDRRGGSCRFLALHPLLRLRDAVAAHVSTGPAAWYVDLRLEGLGLWTALDPGDGGRDRSEVQHIRRLPRLGDQQSPRTGRNHHRFQRPCQYDLPPHRLTI